MQTLTEGKAKIKVKKEKPSKKMSVFYNSVMEFNRDMTIAVLNSLGRKDMMICLPLAGTGVRGIRILLETKCAKEVHMNDLNPSAVKNINLNLKTNGLEKKAFVYNEEANKFLINSEGFDYIDVDPFGTPNPYLANSIKKLVSDGVLAVTATDTSSLSGTYPNACLRKYWAMPLRNELKHEIGLRILIRKVQLLGAQFGRALMPIFSYSKEHYLRVFFQSEKSKEKTDEVLKLHGMFNNAGPMWLGKLKNQKIVDKMYSLMPSMFLKLVKEEMDVIGFYDIHKLCKKYKLKKIPKIEELLKKTKGTRTIFCKWGVKSKIKEEKLITLLKG